MRAWWRPRLGDRHCFRTSKGSRTSRTQRFRRSRACLRTDRRGRADYARGGHGGLRALGATAPTGRTGPRPHDRGGIRARSRSSPTRRKGSSTSRSGCLGERANECVLFDGEFPANVTPWQQAAEEFGLELCWLSLDAFHRSVEEGLAELERRSRPWGSGRRGERSPIQDGPSHAARRDGRALPQVRRGDLRRCDPGARCDTGRCVVGHRLPQLRQPQAPDGGRRSRLLVRGRTLRERAETQARRLARPRGPDRVLDRGRAHSSATTILFNAGAPALEIGTSNVIGLAALGASIELLEQLGVPRIHAHVDALSRCARSRVSSERGFRSHRARRRSFVPRCSA